MAREYNGNYIPTKCWKCRYGIPYRDNDFRCIWEKSKGQIIPDYVDDYRVSSNYDTDASILILSCERYERDPRYAALDKPQPEPKPKRTYTRRKKYQHSGFVMLKTDLIRVVLKDRGISIRGLVRLISQKYQKVPYTHTWEQLSGRRSIKVERAHQIETILGVQKDTLWEEMKVT